MDPSASGIERRARLIFRTEAATAALPFGIGLLFKGSRKEFCSAWDALSDDERERYRVRARRGE